MAFEWPQSHNDSWVKEYQLECDGKVIYVDKEPRFVTRELGLGPHECTLVAVSDQGYVSAPITRGVPVNKIDSSLVPPGLTAESTAADTVLLSWSFGPDGAPGTGKIAIYRDGLRLGDVDIPVATYIDTGLTPATTYRYTVRLWDPIGNRESPNSEERTVRTRDASTPGPYPDRPCCEPPPPTTKPPTTAPTIAQPPAPTGLTVTARTATSISLAWDFAHGVTYELSDHGIPATATQPAFVSTGLTPATQYQYQVRAVDGAGRKSPYVSISSSTSDPAAHASGHVWMQPNAVEHLDNDQRNDSTQYDIAYAPSGGAFNAEYGAAFAAIPAGGAAWDYRTCRSAAGWKATLSPAEFTPGQRVCVRTSLSRYGMIEFQTGPDGSVDVNYVIWREVPPDNTWW